MILFYDLLFLLYIKNTSCTFEYICYAYFILGT